jgi:hypothetical protein
VDGLCDLGAHSQLVVARQGDDLRLPTVSKTSGSPALAKIQIDGTAPRSTRRPVTQRQKHSALEIPGAEYQRPMAVSLARVSARRPWSSGQPVTRSVPAGIGHASGPFTPADSVAPGPTLALAAG